MGEKVGINKQDLPSAIWGIFLGGIYFVGMWYSRALTPTINQTLLRLGLHLAIFFVIKNRWDALKLERLFWLISLGIFYLTSFWFAGIQKLPRYWLVLLIFIQILAFLIVRVLWYYFFAQFILPVRTNEERKKIYTRLIKKSTGAVLFIEDGKLVAKEGESEKSGDGVIVLDSASAVVIRKNNQYTKAAGPGVLFTEKGETIAGSPVPLQKLKDSFGPEENEDPFTPKSPDEDVETYTARQRRRYETSALTRDMIEVVPNINITFKIDADPAKEDEDGSRFGYAEDPVRKAIWHTTIDHKNGNKELYWNQLPIHLTADLWREYLGKYRFEELFKPDQDIVDIATLSKVGSEATAVDEEKKNAESTASEIKYDYNLRGLLCDILRGLNNSLEKRLNAIAARISPPLQEEEKIIESAATAEKEKPTQETALQSITRFMAQRLKNPYYMPIDRYGRVLESAKPRASREYHFLKERGIRVLGVGVNNLRFAQKLEDALLSSWHNTWLQNAKDEATFVKKQQQLYKTRGKEEALIEYADDLSQALENKNLRSPEQALKLLLRATRDKLVNNGGLHKDAEEEIQQLTDLITWINQGGEPLG